MCIQQNVLEDTTSVNETDLNEMGQLWKCSDCGTAVEMFRLENQRSVSLSTWIRQENN